MNSKVRRDESNGWKLITKFFVLCPDSTGPLLSEASGNPAVDFLSMHSSFRQLIHAKFQKYSSWLNSS